MKYYKSISGDVFAFESDGSQDEYISPDLIPMTPDEVQAHLNPQPSAEELESCARAKRDRLLLESDWIVTRSIETNGPIPPDWLAYRQALRDVPEQEGFPANINWPGQPEAQ